MPSESEEEIGNAKVRAIFGLSDGSTVLGCKVEKGILKRDCKVYVVRSDEILGESKIKSIRINKDQVNEVRNGFECGIQLTDQVEAKEGDEIYAGTVIVNGEGEAKVIKTGKSTKMGEIVSTLKTIKPPKTNLQIMMKD